MNDKLTYVFPTPSDTSKEIKATEKCRFLRFFALHIFRLENALRIQNTQVEKYIFKSWVSDNTFSGG